MSNRLAAWIGWPGSGPAPGHDWLPGPNLRFTILGLAYAFLALALTVNYAASGTFFLLALLGMYVGFRRGFVNGLTRTEKLVFLAFAAYPTVAIASYLLGTQTNIGFRWIGRDLRFLLFIPVYLAIRWARPSERGLFFSLAVGVAFDIGSALWQMHYGPAGARAHGVTSVAIIFGDLSLLVGWLAAILFIGKASVRGIFPWVLVVLILGAGIAASLLSGSRGGWIAIPLLGLIFIVSLPPGGARVGATGVVAGSLLVLVVLALVPGNMVYSRVNEGIHNLRTYYRYTAGHPLLPRMRYARCLNRQDFLRDVAAATKEWTPGQRILIRVVNVQDALRRGTWAQLCNGGYALQVSVPAQQKGWTTLLVPRSTLTAGLQPLAILARGRGILRSPVPSREAHFDEKTFNEVSILSPVWGYGKLVVSVLPAATLTFIPLQMRPGSYYYFYTVSSVGVRLEMWRFAARYWLGHPWLGIGTGAYQSWNHRMIDRNEMPPGLWPFEHAHNDYMTVLATEGFVGLLALLGLYLVPAYFFYRRQTRQKRGKSVFAGFAVVGGFMIFGLTETIFSHSLAISWYTLIVAVLMASVTQHSAVRPPPAL